MGTFYLEITFFPPAEILYTNPRTWASRIPRLPERPILHFGPSDVLNLLIDSVFFILSIKMNGTYFLYI